MALTAAERQARYHARHIKTGAIRRMEYRAPLTDAIKIEQLANYWGCSRTSAVTRAVAQALENEAGDETMIGLDTASSADIISDDLRNNDFKPVLHNIGVLEWLPTKLLQIDDAYQRQLDERRAFRIAREWDWSKIKVLNICIRAGEYYITDGQHIQKAAIIRGDIKRLPCYILVDTEQKDEAGMALGINTARRSWTAIDRYRASLAAEDQECVELQDIFDSFGLTLASAAEGKMRHFSCIGIMAHIHRAYKKIGGLPYVLGIVDAAWNCTATSLSSRFLRPLSMFLHSAQTHRTERDIIAFCQRLNPELIIRKSAAEYHTQKVLTYNRIASINIASEHDRRCRKIKLLPVLMAQVEKQSRKNKKSETEENDDGQDS